MPRLRPFAAVLLVIIAGCSDQSTPLAPQPDPNAPALPSAAGLMGSNITRVVVSTQEYLGFAQPIERTVTSFDQRGNPVDEFARLGPWPMMHWQSAFNQYGNVVHQVCDSYRYATNDILTRYTTSTTEYDGRGNPTAQLYVVDNGADGTVDSQRTIHISYDPQGNAIKTEFGNFDAAGIDYIETRTYDAHGNVLQYSQEGVLPDGTTRLQRATSSSYSHHDALVTYSSATIKGETEILQSMSTIAYDPSGNPVRQRSIFSSDGVYREATTTTIGPYDEHRNPLLKMADVDEYENGTIDFQIRTTYQYFGVGHAPDAPAGKHAAVPAAVDVVHTR